MYSTMFLKIYNDNLYTIEEEVATYQLHIVFHVYVNSVVSIAGKLNVELYK